MSNDLRTYRAQRPARDTAFASRVDRASVTAMVMKEPTTESARGVQLTLGRTYIQLTEQQAYDLAMLILRRVDPEDPIESTAASLGEFGTMYPDGSLGGDS